MRWDWTEKLAATQEQPHCENLECMLLAQQLSNELPCLHVSPRCLQLALVLLLAHLGFALWLYL